MLSFNSRTPGGVRHRLETEVLNLRVVSIHAPREGCDSVQGAQVVDSISFNSRTPGGVRLLVQLVLLEVSLFQFTHPGRGATIRSSQTIELSVFQFTHPGRGATSF